MTTDLPPVPTVNGDGPTVASAEELRAALKRPTYLELPESGLTVEVSRAHIADLARAGRIPNRLTGAVMRTLRMAGAPPAPDSLDELVAETADLIEAVCMAVLVKPRMAPAPIDGSVLRPADLSFRDKETIYGWACRTPGVVPLETFRDGPSEPVAPVADGPDVGEATE